MTTAINTTIADFLYRLEQKARYAYPGKQINERYFIHLNKTKAALDSAARCPSDHSAWITLALLALETPLILNPSFWGTQGDFAQSVIIHLYAQSLPRQEKDKYSQTQTPQRQSDERCMTDADRPQSVMSQPLTYSQKRGTPLCKLAAMTTARPGGPPQTTAQSGGCTIETHKCHFPSPANLTIQTRENGFYVVIPEIGELRLTPLLAMEITMLLGSAALTASPVHNGVPGARISDPENDTECSQGKCHR